MIIVFRAKLFYTIIQWQNSQNKNNHALYSYTYIQHYIVILIRVAQVSAAAINSRLQSNIYFSVQIQTGFKSKQTNLLMLFIGSPNNMVSFAVDTKYRHSIKYRKFLFLNTGNLFRDLDVSESAARKGLYRSITKAFIRFLL